MRIQLVRVGNSRGLRLPRPLLDRYGIVEGDELELEERQEGFLLKPVPRAGGKISFEDSYREMADEAAERAEWVAWDGLARDGLDD